MKKIVASVGLVALGAAGLQTASAQDVVGPDTSKPWSVSATLRGFYDDNPGTVPNDIAVHNRDTFGFEVSPAAALAWSMEQTTINLGLLYSLKYYDTKPPGYTEHDAQAFTFNAGLSHAFSEQLRARVSDSFIIGQEPDMLRAGNSYATFQTVSGDNIRNHGMLALDAQLTPKLGAGLGYDNAYYDYSNSGSSAPSPFTPITPSLSGILDRMENRAHIEGTYQLMPETKALLGYQFTDISYTSDEYISGFAPLPPFFPGNLAKSNIRNMREHTFYVGAEHSFSPQFTGSVRAGASYSDYYKNPEASSAWTPYVNGSLKYTYAPESYVEGGISYDRSATDLVGGTGGPDTLVMDSEAAVIFASIHHRIDPRLFASIVAQFQNSMYNGGFANNESEQFYLVGLNLEYKFNQYFSAHIGYNYDRLESDLGRTFDRNRVYIGVTASY